MIRDFCTYFDHRYLPRGLAMFRSLKQHCPSARLWVLCLSPACYQGLIQLAWPDVIPISLEEFERGDRELQNAKTNRNEVEYYFTCTPSLPLYVLTHNSDVNLITYLDADLFFFGSPEPIFTEMTQSSVGIIPHRFSAQLQHLDRTGIYNVGWLTFRRDSEGIACLKWWRERCLEWCHDYVDGDRYGDQKYLDRFPKLFRGVTSIQHKGANVAAWNLKNYRLRERDGTLYVDEQPILFYHFQGLRNAAPGIVDPGVAQYGLRLSWIMERKLYRPYLNELEKAQALAPSSIKDALLSATQRRISKERGPIATRIRRIAKTMLAYARVITRRSLVVFPREWKGHIGRNVIGAIRTGW
jgi:hypothetical protein